MGRIVGYFFDHSNGLGARVAESDSMVAIQLINGGCDEFHPYASLVNQIRVWLARDWDCRCVHICREANQVADCLAGVLPLAVLFFYLLIVRECLSRGLP